MRVKKIAVAAVLALALGWSAVAPADLGWSSYRSNKYGFAMLAPPGATFVERELGGGWGTLEATHEGIKFLGVAKLGEWAKPEDIETFGVRLTGISPAQWKQVDKGTNQNGWAWYRTVEATDGRVLVFGGYGIGAKGSYLILLQTTVKDYEDHKADYRKWYDSITLF
jgi:hypothetical protein